MSFTDDIDNEVDNIIVDVINDNNDDNNNCLRRTVSVKIVDDSQNCQGDCDNCDCDNEDVDNENNTECNSNNVYDTNKAYLKHILMYIYISYNFMNGFYKSLVHAVCPNYFKEDIVNIVKKLESKICKKTD